MFFNWGHFLIFFYNWEYMGANVLVEFENVFFLIGGLFITIGGKKLYWDRENHLFWELYGPLSIFGQ